MITVTKKDGVQISCQDCQPDVFPHSWPLTAGERQSQMLYFGGAS